MTNVGTTQRLCPNTSDITFNVSKRSVVNTNNRVGQHDELRCVLKVATTLVAPTNTVGVMVSEKRDGGVKTLQLAR